MSTFFAKKAVCSFVEHVREGDVVDAIPCMSIRELIVLMDACNADYGNWGICVSGECLWLGDDNKGEVLSVPLIDVIDHADEYFSDYGYEEVFLIFDFGRNGTAIEWELYTSVCSKH